jgi:hypothetical protein
MDAARDLVVRRLGDVLRRVTLGCSAVEAFPDGPLDSAQVFFQMVVDTRPTSRAESRSDFLSWLLGVGLSEAIESVVDFVEDLIAFAKLIDATSNDQLHVPRECTAAELPSIIRGQVLKGVSRSLPDRLQLLGDKFGIRSGIHGHLLTINQMRNCLTHRRGVVGLEDVKNDSERRSLRVTYLAFEVVCEGPNGRVEPLGPDRIIQAGWGVGVRRIDKEKSFPLGTRVNLSAQDFHDVIATLSTAADPLKAAMCEYADSHGLLRRMDQDDGTKT